MKNEHVKHIGHNKMQLVWLNREWVISQVDIEYLFIYWYTENWQL